jgi:hypothetical protein
VVLDLVQNLIKIMEVTKKMKTDKQSVRTNNSEKFVIDGMNVCFWFKQNYDGLNRASVRPLLLLLCEIREHGDDFYCVFDHKFNNLLKSEREIRLADWMVWNYPLWFYRTTIDTSADPVILHYADKHECRIISNDRYRNYFNRFSWLSKHNTPRLIQGNYHPSGLLTIEKISYGYMELDYLKDTQTLVKRLIACLDHNYDWSSARKVENTAQAEIIENNKIGTIASTTPASSPEKVNSKMKGIKKKASTRTADHKESDSRTSNDKKAGNPKTVKAIKKIEKTKLKNPKEKTSVSKRTKSQEITNIVENSNKISVQQTTKSKPRSVRRRTKSKEKGFFEWLFG